MDNIKIGRLIARLRKEKDLTQQNIADALSISNKTVSKWECGLGLPDVSLWTDLSTIFGVDMALMMEGEITPNKPDSGNLNRIKFYVCPSCSNVLTSTGSATIHCCGKKLEEKVAQESALAPTIKVEHIDVDYFISFEHEMTRDNYILFAAYVKNDKLYLNRLYPEQNPSVRVPYSPGGKLYLYSLRDGLAMYSLPR